MALVLALGVQGIAEAITGFSSSSAIASGGVGTATGISDR